MRGRTTACAGLALAVVAAIGLATDTGSAHLDGEGRTLVAVLAAPVGLAGALCLVAAGARARRARGRRARPPRRGRRRVASEMRHAREPLADARRGRSPRRQQRSPASWRSAAAVAAAAMVAAARVNGGFPFGA